MSAPNSAEPPRPESETSENTGECADTGERADEAAAPSESNESDRRILVVDDEPATRDAMRQLLEARGWRVSVVRSARDAVAMLSALAQPLRWVVLDLLLADGDGIEVLALARRHRLAMGVVVVTAVTDSDHLARARALGPDALLRKPLDFNRLLEVLEARP